MKKNFFFLILLFISSCYEDKGNEFTSVEGYVTDYYSKKPVAGIPILIEEEDYICIMCMPETDTVYSNTDGYYYHDFFNKEKKSYEVSVPISENYFEGLRKKIWEGRANKINFSLKPFKILTLNCYNKSYTYNWLDIYSYLNDEDFYCRQCAGLTVYKIKIVHEERNKISIQVSHYENNKRDSTKIDSIKFYSAKNDTTINYYY